MGTFKAQCHIYSMNTSGDNRNNVNNLWITLNINKGYKMKKTFKNAVKVLNWRLDKYTAEYKEIDGEIKNMQNNEDITWNDTQQEMFERLLSKRSYISACCSALRLTLEHDLDADIFSWINSYRNID